MLSTRSTTPTGTQQHAAEQGRHTAMRFWVSLGLRVVLGLGGLGGLRFVLPTPPHPTAPLPPCPDVEQGTNPKFKS